jgi:zinc protease
VVSAVAYNGCGDLSLSEDIAQETFWTAWRERTALLDPSRLRAWLCGIARNMARNSNRREARGASQLDESVEPTALTPEPADEAVSREEETLVWEALEEIPDNYREPLILFYREHQSVAEVAEALDVSTDAVKQRLSRGREMLREQVASLVEGALRRSRPQAGFTLSVMAGLTAMTAGSKMALAGAGAATAAGTGGAAVAMKGVPASMFPAGPVLATSTGVLGGLAGTMLGLAGGWLGVWIPAQFAPTNRERMYQLRVGWRMFCVCAVMSALLFALMFTFATKLPAAWIAGITIGWVMTLNVYIWSEISLMAWAIKRIRAETLADSDPNDSPIKEYVQRTFVGSDRVSRWEGRVYRSSISLLGWPLIDINVSDPNFKQPVSPAERPVPKQARGWIAIGDKADGILLAIGGVARGGVAIGGLAIGIVGAGGMAIGLLTLGGLSIGALALGGGAIGVIALGGGAIGWQAGGGFALAWDVACGGLAIARHAAFGGGAMAYEFAVGGGASAAHANDAAAHAILDQHWLVTGTKWLAANNALVTIVILVGSLLPSLVMMPLMYRRRRDHQRMA